MSGFDKSMSILVVDDFKTMRRIIRGLLNEIGFTNIDEASDGGEALTKAQAKSYHLIISDWNMEPMSGIQLLEKVRAIDRYSSTPFIMVTAENKLENVVEAKKRGVDDYIVKPFNAKTLESKLSNVLNAA